MERMPNFSETLIWPIRNNYKSFMNDYAKHPDIFTKRHIGPSDDDVALMLNDLGFSSMSEFINNVGIGIAIFILTLFLTIVVGKTLSRAVTWTGVGSIDKSFGLIFGVFKGYVVSVCIFSILNWFYPYTNWGISAEDALSFNIINKGSEILIDEFPSSEDFIDTKEKIEKI